MKQTVRLARLVALLAALVALASVLTTSTASALDIHTEVSLPDGEVGVPYEFQFTGEEGCQPYNFSHKSGTLPPGLTIQRDGKLVGTPTQAGTFVFWVELDDGVPGGACHSPVPSQGEYSVFIAPRVEITATTLPGAKAGRPYTAAVTATGGGSLQWTVTEGALPSGLSLNRDTGALAGTPSSAGSFPFTVKVADDKRKATQHYAFVVAAPLGVQSVSVSLTEVGVPLSATIPSTGGIGPLRWSVAGGALPGGLALDASNGVIQGTPSAAGSFTVRVTAQDSDGETANAVVRLIVARRLAVAPARIAKATAGTSYRLRLVARGGIAPRIWRLVSGSLPRGVTLTRGGALIGAPRTAGRYRITVKVTDKLGAVATRAITLTVVPRA
jgi:large repetitive protein